MGLWQVGADGINLNFWNFIVLLFRRTETFLTFVSNSTSVIYIGRRSGGRVSNPPPDHKPFSLADMLNDTLKIRLLINFPLFLLKF